MIAQSNTNGSPNGVDMNHVADVLQDEVTSGYIPTMPLEAMWLSGADMPQITLRRDIEFMQLHPIVYTALEYYKGGIMGAEFWGGPDHQNPDNNLGKPISLDQRVAEFVLAHVERFWQRGMPLLQEGGYAYGWAAGEHIYKERNGMLIWSHLKDFHPNDSFVLTLKYKPIGIRIKSIRGREPVDLWYAQESIPAKACWYPHRPRFNQFYGRSQLMTAWLPWRMLGFRDGMDQVINAAVYRAGYRGPIVQHPPEDMQTAQTGIPATANDSQGHSRRSARDVARQMVEWAKAGAGFTMSSAQYPQAQGGGPKWKIDFPDHVMDVRPLVDAAKWCEERIMMGIGVPPELIKAGGTGSGFSGRSIPRDAFLEGQQRIADQMLQIFVEQVVRPLVKWNFGDIPFEISCKSLLQSQSENEVGQVGNAGAGGSKAKRTLQQPTPGGQPPPQGAQGDPSAQPMQAPMSLEARAKVLAIVQRVIRESA